jgi:tetratricopeptide (TPR) repeat protein
MRNNYYTKILNWVLPVFVVFIILTGNFIEALVILFAYLIYRFVSERDKFYSYFGKRSYLKGKLTKAIQWYEKANRTRRAEAKVRISYAYALILSGKFQLAGEALAESSNVPDADTVIMQRAICEAVLRWKEDGNLVGAIQRLRHMDETLRTSSYYGILGKMMIASGEETKAREFSEEAYSYNEKNTQILENLITIYCMANEFERAAKVANILIKKKPSTIDGWYYCGLAKEKTGEAGKAARCYKKALKCEETLLTTIKHTDIKI